MKLALTAFAVLVFIFGLSLQDNETSLPPTTIFCKHRKAPKFDERFLARYRIGTNGLEWTAWMTNSSDIYALGQSAGDSSNYTNHEAVFWFDAPTYSIPPGTHHVIVIGTGAVPTKSDQLTIVFTDGTIFRCDIPCKDIKYDLQTNKTPR